PASRASILELLDELVHGGCAVIHITHDMAEAARAGRILALSEGRIAYDGESQGFFARDDLAELGLERPQAMRIASALGLKPIPAESARALSARIAGVSATCPELRAAAVAMDSPAAAVPVAALDAELAFSAENLVFRYLEGSGDESLALGGLSLALPVGKSLALVGATGSGKSTLLQLFAALANPSSGSVRVLGIDPSASGTDLRALRMSSPLSVQRPESAIFELYAGDEVAFGPRNQGLKGAALVERVLDAMDAVGLPYGAFRDRASRALSGGQKRRLALASVLSMRPQALVMDEPGSALDPGSRAGLMDTLFAAAKGRAAFVYSTHSMEEAARADYLAVLSSGRLAAFGPPSELFGKGFCADWGIARPFAAELAAELRALGMDIPIDVLHEDQLVFSLQGLRAGADPAVGLAKPSEPGAAADKGRGTAP
ncbi:MAG TPA: hypothetical protein DCG47_01510, partial [Spirochaetaceae bacterium]|nr:hypothetical protein [Spirochaetaceae bacterium]